MCDKCGCSHDHEQEQHHHDEDAETARRVLTVQARILSENDRVAEANRRLLAAHSAQCLNLISAPGSGKTLLLERTLDALRGRISCAVIAGDPHTDNDSRRLTGRNAPVCQIQTHGACHLTAAQVGALIPRLLESSPRLIFIENVGNLVCPAAFDLGETMKIAMLSVTEGEDKPLKYPALFSHAQVVVVTKTDLLPHVDCDVELLERNLRGVQPAARVFKLSAKSGAGMDEWLEWLRQQAR